MDSRLHRAIESVKVIEEKRPRKLSGAIGAKVEKENHIVIPNPLLVRIRKNQRFEEFIGLALLIPVPDGVRRRALNDLPSPSQSPPGELVRSQRLSRSMAK